MKVRRFPFFRFFTETFCDQEFGIRPLPLLNVRWLIFDEFRLSNPKIYDLQSSAARVHRLHTAE